MEQRHFKTKKISEINSFEKENGNRERKRNENFCEEKEKGRKKAWGWEFLLSPTTEIKKNVKGGEEEVDIKDKEETKRKERRTKLLS